MDNTRYIALTNQMALWNKLDMISNNIANMNTTGYKREEPVFAEYLTKSNNNDEETVNKTRFVQSLGTYRDFSEGAFIHTGNDLDVAIHGDAFFSVQTPEGERYTKKGAFTINNENQITTNDGFLLLAENGEAISIDPNETEITITKDGSILQGKQDIGKIKLVEFSDINQLEKTHSGLYKTQSNNQTEIAENSSLEQGMLEKSNVNPIIEMTKMIDVQRAYERAQRVIEIEHERQSDAIQSLSAKASV